MWFAEVDNMTYHQNVLSSSFVSVATINPNDIFDFYKSYNIVVYDNVKTLNLLLIIMDHIYNTQFIGSLWMGPLS